MIVRAGERLVVAGELVRRELAGHDVVGEDLGERRLVGEDLLQGGGGDLGERVVDGAKTVIVRGRVQRVDEAGRP